MSRPPENPAPDVAVVLVRTQEEGNLGSVARAMANMGLARLILVRPRPEIGPTARAFAVGAAHVLDGVERFDTLAEAIAPFRRVVATTSGRGRREEPLPPRRLPEMLAADPAGTPTALVFGPEASGLTTEELALASLVVRVPCAPRQPTLNLAQAVLVVAYELYLARLAGGSPVPTDAEPPAPATQIEGLMTQAEGVLRTIGFARDDTFGSVLRDLRRLLARAAPNERELAILRGICRRAGHRFER